jgi:hypothetical protein
MSIISIRSLQSDDVLDKSPAPGSLHWKHLDGA